MKFVYRGFQAQIKKQDLIISFDFLLSPNVSFKPQITIHNLPTGKLDLQALEAEIFNLGMIELFSYWKAAAPEEIIVENFALNSKQIAFWQDLLLKGMGEFFYVNNIDFTANNFVTIKSTATKIASSSNLSLQDKVLIPLGGGKDSLVTLETIKKNFPQQVVLFTLNPSQSVKNVLKVNPDLPVITVDRQLDPTLLKLNQEGYLNGHTPFSAYLAFLTNLVAKIWGIKYIALSNESSANEESLFFHGQAINHQYSKSFDFEQKFQQYAAGKSPLYFSFLRPLNELQIAEKFSQLTPYHQIFRSCNRGQKTNTWCGECPKCLFAFTILYPFIDEEKMIEIFGQNLFDKTDLWPTALELMGKSAHKPLECVGTYEENVIAFYLSYQKVKQYHKRLSNILEKFAQEVLPHEKNLAVRASEILTNWHTPHSLTTKWESILKFSGKKILVLGMGREGQSTLSFLKKNVPYCELFTADEKDGSLPKKEWAQMKFDFVFKTPGIPVEKLAKWEISFDQLYSNTQLFFDLLANLPTATTIIGVTGTKGKTTTTSLIYHVLKTAGKKVALGGNIGTPALDLLTTPAQIYVLELSAHQLAELKSSPQIAVIQEISPDHLDYYPNMKAYAQAKSQISRWQTANDISYYFALSSLAADIAHLSPGKKQSFDYKSHPQLTKLINASQPKFLGQHNLINALPAVLIAQQLGVDEATVRQALHSFEPVAHRLELVKEISGVRYYNDSAANAPSAVVAALKTFAHQSLVLITGGLDRNLDLSDLAQEILRSQIRYLILFPSNGSKIVEAIKVIQPQAAILSNYQLANSMPEAVKLAKAKAQPGDVVLLSPGSASFNLFQNYEDRGRQFKTAVLT